MVVFTPVSLYHNIATNDSHFIYCLYYILLTLPTTPTEICGILH